MANEEHLKILRQGVTAWDQWRAEKPSREPELSDADLTAIDLSGAYLVGAKLARANLTRAKLTRTKLSIANLFLANLAGANLTGAELFSANLALANFTGANLSGVDLSAANLAYANLTEADLSGAAVDETTFANTNLSKAKGLNIFSHHGPSPLDLRTSQRSGMLPEVFLRGCGLPDDYIAYLPSLLNQPIQFYSCFISYSHADQAFARRLHDALQGRGIRCWLDEHQLVPGDHVHRSVDEAVRLWDKVLLCCSQASLNSWWVDKEIQKALQKEERLFKERGKEVLAIIPLNLDGYIFDPQWTDWKQQHVTSRLAANFQGWEQDNALFETQFEKVVKALRTDAASRPKPPPSKL